MKPLIGMPSDTRNAQGLLYHSAGDKYADAITTGARALPVFIPASADRAHLRETVRHLHGVLITGAPSNVHPRHYGAGSLNARPYDEPRDATSFALIELALEEGVPLLAICRGQQELNVALGGSLSHDVHQTPGNLDHLGDTGAEVAIRYGPRHEIDILPNSTLGELLGADKTIVNSVHRQAIDRPANDIVVEAVAPDGIIEAVTVKNAGNFAVGVQWHPEYDIARNPHSQSLFKAFGKAAATRLEN